MMVCPYRIEKDISIFENGSRKSIGIKEYFPHCENACPFYRYVEVGPESKRIESCLKANKEKPESKIIESCLKVNKEKL